MLSTVFPVCIRDIAGGDARAVEPLIEVFKDDGWEGSAKMLRIPRYRGVGGLI